MISLISIDEKSENYTLESLDLYLQHISNQLRLIDQKLAMKIENEITYTYNNPLKKIEKFNFPIT